MLSGCDALRRAVPDVADCDGSPVRSPVSRRSPPPAPAPTPPTSYCDETEADAERAEVREWVLNSDGRDDMLLLNSGWWLWV